MERVASRALTARAGLLGSHILGQVVYRPSATQVATEPLRINKFAAKLAALKRPTRCLSSTADLPERVQQAAILPAKRDHRIIEQMTPMPSGYPRLHGSRRPSTTECTLRATSGGTSLNGGETEYE